MSQIYLPPAITTLVSATWTDSLSPTPEDWGTFLSRFRWTHFITLTASFSVNERRMRDEFKRWVRNNERIAQGRIDWFMVIEYDAIGQQPHIHALLAGPPTMLASTLERTWWTGRKEIAPYDHRRGAAYYVAKTLAHNPDGYDLSHKLPREWVDHSGAEFRL